MAAAAIPFPARGVHQGYRARDTGCVIVIGGVLPETTAHAKKYAAALCARVKATSPAASCLCQWMPPTKDGGSDLHVIVHVDADELAVFKFGPMHRRAIRDVRMAARRGERWWDWEGKV